MPEHISWLHLSAHLRRLNEADLGGWGRRAVAGLSGLSAFLALLHLGEWVGGPPVRLALWLGTLFTANFAWGTAIGRGLEVVLALGATLAYEMVTRRRWGWSRARAAGALGLLWWCVATALLLPLLSLLNPLFRAAILPSPGLFALGQGLAGAVTWPLASLALGLTVAALMP